MARRNRDEHVDDLSLSEADESLPAAAATKFVESSAYRVTIAREAALGNGTRQPGEVPCVVVVTEGYTLGEALTAIRNPHLIEVCPEQ